MTPWESPLLGTFVLALVLLVAVSGWAGVGRNRVEYTQTMLDVTLAGRRVGCIGLQYCEILRGVDFEDTSFADMAHFTGAVLPGDSTLPA